MFRAVVCKRSFWIFSDKGGFLTVRPQVNTWVSKGEVVAELRDLYGSLVKTFIADDDAIVVGRSMDPVCAAGCRVIHLGTRCVRCPSFARRERGCLQGRRAASSCRVPTTDTPDPEPRTIVRSSVIYRSRNTRPPIQPLTHTVNGSEGYDRSGARPIR